MYRKRVSDWEKHLDFMLLDSACLAVSVLLAHAIRRGFFVSIAQSGYVSFLTVALLWNFVLLLLDASLKGVLKRGCYLEFLAVVQHALILLGSIVVGLFVSKSSADYSRVILLLTVVFYMLLTYGVRLTWKRYLSGHTKNAAVSILIMTDAENAEAALQAVHSSGRGYEAVGLVLDDPALVGTELHGASVLADFSSVTDYATNAWVDEVLICLSADRKLPEEVISDLVSMGITVHMSLERSTRIAGRPIVERISGLTVVTFSMNYMTQRQYYAKRALDILGGLVGCLITGILYLFLAPLIRRESPGPVFFSQERIGQNGKPFRFYKFRSMYMDAEERKAELMAQNRRSDNLMFKMDFDPRIIGNRIDANGNRVTGIGEFIRRTSLDEFPQFYNVLRGDMSLVGTRPPVRQEYEQYQAHHKARLAAKPGITGMWQVNGRSNVLDFEEVVRLDTEYINNWSLGLDIKILLKTVLVVLKHEGSM